MSGRYTIGATRNGRYASQLEYDWACAFGFYKFPGKYVGDVVKDHDFELWPNVQDELWVEIKPDDNVSWYRNSFVYAAVRRLFLRFAHEYQLDPKLNKRDAVILVGRYIWLYLSWTPDLKSIAEFDGPVKTVEFVGLIKTITHDLLTPLRELRAGTYEVSVVNYRFKIVSGEWHKID